MLSPCYIKPTVVCSLNFSMASLIPSNAACCSIPPVQASYEPKGTITEFGDFKKVYIVGPEKVKKALVCVFDIFGYWPQTQQGADILAETLNAKVLMPDFFEPHKAYPQEDFPPNTPEKKEKLQEFFQTVAKLDVAVAKVKKLGLLLKAGGFVHIGLYAFCWGGKVSILSGNEKIYDAVASVHPAMVDPSDANDLVVPYGLFPSQDEPIAECEKIVDIISTKPIAAKSVYKSYQTVHHGWAAARADLTDAENKKQYEDLYGTLAAFFQAVWA